jgi:ankyrin repeat protein
MITHAQALELISAAGIVGPCHGNLAEVRRIVEANPQLIEAMNAVDASAVDETPQGAAAHTQSKAIVEYLLEKGVRPNIFMAAAIGDAQQVDAFLRGDPSLAQARGAHGIPLIAHALNRETAEAMLAHDVECSIFMAVNRGLADRVARLMASDPALAHATTPQGLSLVQAACAMGHRDVVKVLLDAGADDPENAGHEFLASRETSGEKWPGHYFHAMHLHGAVFNNVNLGRSTFHNINMAGAALININLHNAIIDFATIDGLKIFGVEVKPLIDAELKRRAAASAPQ